MRQVGRWLLIAAGIVGLPLQGLALNPGTNSSLSNTDVQPAATKDVAPRLSAQAALAELNSRAIEAFTARWDSTTGLPNRLLGRSRSMGTDPEASARRFLSENRALLGVSSSTDELKTLVVQKSLTGYHVRFVQHHQGIPVFLGDLSVHMDKKMQVRLVNSEFVPEIEVVSTTARISRDAAVRAARKAVGLDEKATVLHESTDQTVFASASGASLTWKVVLGTVEPPADWEVLVDAQTGEVVRKENRLRFATGKGKVFNPNACVALKDYTIRDGNDSAGAVADEAYTIVDLQGLDGSGKLKGAYVDVTKGGGNTEDGNDAGEYFYNRSQKAFERVMVYYHLDRAQRYFQSLGFENVNNRTQRVDAHGTTADNSWYRPSTKDLTFGDGGVDDAEDADVILHEYGHSTQDNQVPGWGRTSEGGAMGEAFGDYLAASLRADNSFHPAAVAIWDGTSYSNATPPNLRRVDGTKHYPEGIEGEVHADGEIWSACLWQIWNAIGKEKADKLILEHHFRLSPTAEFADAANALLQVDEDLYGGAHKATIKSIFVARGILNASGTLRVVLRELNSEEPIGGTVTLSNDLGSKTFDVPAETGILETQVPPGEYTARVKAFGYLDLPEWPFIEIKEDETSTLDLTLAAAPRHIVKGTVKAAETGEAIDARITVLGTPLAPVETASEGLFQVELPEGTYTFQAEAFGYKAQVKEDVAVTDETALSFTLEQLPPVLLVDADQGKSYEEQFRSVLDGNQTEYTYWNRRTQGELTDRTVLPYKQVIWFTGDSTSSLSESERESIKTYVQSGGRLFLTGQEIGYALKDTAFYKEFLGAKYLKDTAATKKVLGEGLEFTIEGGDGANNQNYPDVVEPAEGAEGVSVWLSYENDGGAALKVQRGEGRVVYLAFGFEGISTAEHRKQVMDASLAWLEGSVEDSLKRLAAISRIGSTVVASDRDRWAGYVEGYERVLADELAHLQGSEAAAARRFLEAATPADLYRDLKAAATR